MGSAERRGALAWLLAQRPERVHPSGSVVDKHPGAVDLSTRWSSMTGKPPRSNWLGRICSLAIIALIVVSCAVLMRTFVIETYYIPSGSMEPTLHGCPGCDDDRVVVEKVSYLFHDPQPGDVVVFNRPSSGPWARDVAESVLIKRVIGVGGDRIVIKHGHVFRDGRRLIESYVNAACRNGTQAPHRVYRVPLHEVFVMGDNRCSSEDSRFNGPVPVGDVVGRAFLIVWPFTRLHSL